ncbi:hypothetical protein [Mesorhizobium sp. B2-4-14]|uniref:hypothetical protein n=1 Tax=Mesorhizobium sp. B2-4-14 TaxID=2589935 RepID=UPI0015E2CF30|nr:hypothetical protein [Mesorhizobium sp. B2-4-14]
MFVGVMVMVVMAVMMHRCGIGHSHVPVMEAVWICCCISVPDAYEGKRNCDAES